MMSKAIGTTSYVPGDAVLKHGFTLEDIDKLARIAVRYLHRRGVGGEWTTRYDVAYGGVVEHLYAADEAPDEQTLIRAGYQAVLAEIRQDRQSHGDDPDSTGARFAAYWRGSATSHFPEDRIVEKLALVEVLPMLTKVQCDTLLAFASSGSELGAATALGVPVGTVKSRLSAARAVFRRWWLEGETPVRHLDLVRTCRQGHAVDRYGSESGGARYCLKCRSEYKGRRRAKGLAA